MDNMKPDPILRDILVNEDVYIMSDRTIKDLPQEKLGILVDYYKTTLEVLAGKQIWDILDSLKAAELEIYKRNKTPFKKAV